MGLICEKCFGTYVWTDMFRGHIVTIVWGKCLDRQVTWPWAMFVRSVFGQMSGQTGRTWPWAIFVRSILQCLDRQVPSNGDHVIETCTLPNVWTDNPTLMRPVVEICNLLRYHN